ncbi:hypothetical protein KOR42_50040 [Thalassoglobus neptunius]|uniref:Uncharacterized protein n=1 Tax=Thalassoglobus neptunius TaxID=1938619 RepID=A0A5C5VQY2_9PLAN|nr:hypothetical protein KOR42_50040 [Thalassoglobus neptunius]
MIAEPAMLTIGKTFETATTTLFDECVPSSSVTVAEIVYPGESSRKTCVTVDGLPLMVSTLPSPQLISQAAIVSWPGSELDKFNV